LVQQETEPERGQRAPLRRFCGFLFAIARTRVATNP
jgi:hypothetical protein